MIKEEQNIVNDNNIKESNIDKDKNNSTFLPLNEKEQNDSRTNQNLINLQNSGCKNFKNEIKQESANIYM